jgi:hypothetical protein
MLMLATLLGIGSNLRADVDLVTVPRREGTQLTIYNSEDITMVREHRLLTVKQGINRIQFSWANTLIDPTSIDFRILEHQDRVDLIDTTFPAGRNDALQWNIESDMAGQVPVEIRYFTSGITWSASYEGIANLEETKLSLTGYIRVENGSGELYDSAQTRLVVGTINLVEKIADLAQAPPPGAVQVELLEGLDVITLRGQRQDVDRVKGLMKTLESLDGYGEMAAAAPKEVAKAGLSEYFLFTIAGHEDIRDQEPKRLVAMKIVDVPLECLYKLTDRDGGTQFAKYYRFRNAKLVDDHGVAKDLSAMENLGLAPLPNGTIRLYSQYPNRDLAYVGGTDVKYVPIGDRVEVHVGADGDLTMERCLKDQRITNIVARQYERRLDNHFIQQFDLVDYDETLAYEEETVSGKPVDVRVEVERHFDANVVIWSEENPPADWGSDEPGAYVDLHQAPGRVERVDQNHVKYFLDLKPGEKQTVTYKVTYKRRKVGPELNAKKIRRPL